MATRRQQKVGVVTSTKMQKTAVVTVVRQIMHPLYHRVVRRSAKFMAHDEAGNCRVGDTVRIEETRPLSARKRWRVVEVISRGERAAAGPEVAA
jgi:small subunit ribosomal protein S17